MKAFQVHVPYIELLARLDRFLDRKINPEVYLDGDALDCASGSDLRMIRDEFKRNSLTVTMHGPYLGINPGSADEAIRLSTEKRYERVFEVAEDLRPRNIVLHAGYHERKFHGDSRHWLDQSMKTWPRFVKEAERVDTIIAAENIFEKTPSTLKALADEINSPSFRVCVDSGHLSVFSSVPIEDWFKELGPYLAEVHLHDNNGVADEHLPLGEGSIDFKTYFNLIERYAPQAVYTIEPHGEDETRRSIEAIKKFLPQ